MYLFKKFVGLNAGKNPGYEESVENDEDSSSLATTATNGSEKNDLTNNNNSSDKSKEIVSDKKDKKKKRNSEKRKRKKLNDRNSIQSPEIESERNGVRDGEDDSCSVSEPKHVIPDRYYGDVSETTDSERIKSAEQNSSEENSTSQDVSNVELNEESNKGNDFWAESEKDEKTDNNIDSDFWNDRKSDVGVNDASEVDFWGDIIEEPGKGNSDVAGKRSREKVISSATDVSDPEEDKTQTDIDFWGEIQEDTSNVSSKRFGFWEDVPKNEEIQKVEEDDQEKESGKAEVVQKEAEDKKEQEERKHEEEAQELKKSESIDFWGTIEGTKESNASKTAEDFEKENRAYSENSKESQIENEEENRKSSTESGPVVSCTESSEFEGFSDTESSKTETKKDPTVDDESSQKESSNISSIEEEDEDESESQETEDKDEVEVLEHKNEDREVQEGSENVQKDEDEKEEGGDSSEEVKEQQKSRNEKLERQEINEAEKPKEQDGREAEDTESLSNSPKQPENHQEDRRSSNANSIEPEIAPERKYSIGENVTGNANDLEHHKTHRKNFVNVLKEIEQPTRRRSVILPDSRERTWKESKKESLSESIDNDDDRSDGDEGPDHCIMDYLGKENDKAEARLLARRQARVEAREIRLRELERQQKEQEENADKVFDMSYGSDSVLRTARVAPTTLTPRERPLSVTNSYHSSRRSSEDSIEEGLSLRDLRHEVKEIEEKFRKAMIANAQLDNEKSALVYQVELLKDKLEDLEETHAQLSREHRDKCREHEQLKRAAVKLKEDLACYKYELDERDKLIADYGLVIVGGDGEDEESCKKTLVSIQSAELLQQAGTGSLDVRLKKFAEERNELLDEIRHLKLELEEEKNKRRSDTRNGFGSFSNGPLDEETGKILADYKFKLQKAEQDVSTLQANVARLESQVIRYKSAAETSEKAEDELKIEKRKLQRENRESIARIEELETANSHLLRRMDKLKNAKSALLKEL